ncbi:MAG: ion channel [Daejeonella sp.]
MDALKIYDNKFITLGFDPFKIPDGDNTIYWNDISTSNTGLRTQEYGNFGSKHGFYTGTTEDQVGNLIAYKDLVKFYKKYYDAYKINGDIRSANQVFVEIKDLETLRLTYEYKENPNFNTYFQIKLNKLLKFYTAFGTDPAKALIISVWLLIMFAVFYFFFPSTWDITSKSRLVNDFKLFIEKNEHGYFKPFLRLLFGFFISLLNALTLSLNSFVTLGFGEIPTKGLARYVTIIQGFIGWFLLSLFTVALLNQVIF